MNDKRQGSDGRTAFDVAIVGGGFSGSMLAVHLLHRARRPLAIALFDANNAFGKGVAYSTECPDHRLNVPAAKMSAFEGRPHHLVAWLRAHENVRAEVGLGDVEDGDFIPRAAYGRYVRALLGDALANAPQATLAQRVAHVVDLDPGRDGVRVSLVGAPPVHARRVVVATGTPVPGNPLAGDLPFFASSCYVKNPWGRASASRMQRAGEVLIVGSGLTALDAVMTARRGARISRIHVLSRHGRFPAMHRVARPFDGDLSRIAGERTIAGMVRAFREIVAASEPLGCDWRSIVDALRPLTAQLWRSMSVVERRRFVRHVRSLWETHRHRSAPEIVIEAAALEASGLVQRHIGRLRELQEIGGRARVRYSNPLGLDRTLDVDLVVNCTGPSSDLRSGNDPLLQSLLSRGLARQDAARLGLETAEDGALAGANGATSSHLFALGFWRRASVYESTAVPELRVQAEALADVLLSAHERHPDRRTEDPDAGLDIAALVG